jgi:hypothetical protein
MSDVVVGWQAGHNMHDPNSGTASERTIAQNALEALVRAYPGHPWYVEVRGGLLIIRNYRLDWRGRYCMVRKLANVQHDYGRLTREVVMAAGEFLERAAIKRGAAREGEHAQVLEGAEKFKPAPSGLLVPA